MATNPGSAALADNPGAAAPAAAPGAETSPAAAAPAAEKPWTEQAGVDPKFASAIAAKGWTNANDVLESYTQVEKLVSLERGGDVDRILVKPKADATPEEVAAFRAKAGFAAPAEASEYGFTPETISTQAVALFSGSGLPAEMAGQFALEMTPVVEAAAGWMKEAGVPTDVAQGLVGQVLAREVQALKDFHTNSTREFTELQTELGDKYGDFEESARRAFRATELDKGILDKLEMTLGTKGMMQMFAKFGGAMSEAAAPTPGKGASAGQFTQSAEQAQARIQVLQRDNDFQAKLLSTNPEVRKASQAEWEQLFKTAYPA